jgi:hypothetical protein
MPNQTDNIERLNASVDKLIRQRRDLLEAVEIALIFLEDGAPNTAADRLRAVVAKIEGKEAQHG